MLAGKAAARLRSAEAILLDGAGNGRGVAGGTAAATCVGRARIRTVVGGAPGVLRFTRCAVTVPAHPRMSAADAAATRAAATRIPRLQRADMARFLNCPRRLRADWVHRSWCPGSGGRR